MSSNDKYQNNDWEEEDESGQGGQGDQVEFHDFLGGSAQRDDMLPADEKRRLLSVHQDIHELHVKKQKEQRETRNAIKEGKLPLQDYRQGLMQSGMQSAYPPHPTLKDKVQFSGSTDNQVTVLPNESIAETNQEKREELENQYRLRHQPEYAPRFHPKPKPQ